MPAELSNIIWSIVGLVFTGLASFGVTKLTAWINSKTKDKETAEKLNKIVGIITDSVKQIYQEFVEVLKSKGSFDEAAQKEAKEKATLVIKGQLTEELNTFITNNFGNIDIYINNQIEVVLYNLKNIVSK